MADNDTKTTNTDWQRRLQDSMRQAIFQAGNAESAGAAAPGGSADKDGEEEGARDKAILQRIRSFAMKPREVRDYLDRFVVQQHDAKKVLSVALCDHYNHVRRCMEDPAVSEMEYSKPNIILLGPTGVGKTYLMRCVARLVGVPFVKADATKFSETGYVGYDVEDIVRDLVRVANGNTAIARYGIIYIDEIDKISAQPSVGRDVSGRGVQINLLKLMEETEVNLHSQTDLLGQMQAMIEMQRSGKPPHRTINTRHMLFIVSGAFDKLSDIVRQRIQQSRIGFGSDAASREVNDSVVLRAAQSADFIKYGFEPEFIGRLPVRVVCEGLTASDLEEIMLKSEGNVLNQYREDFKGYGIGLDVTPDAIGTIARDAVSEGIGARGLLTVLERLLRPYKYELPSTNIRHLDITAAAVNNAAAHLREVLLAASASQRDVLRTEVGRYAARFLDEHGLTLEFTDDAVERLVEISLASGKTIHGICEQRFRDFQFGLKLIARNTGRTSFTIGKPLVDSPDTELSHMVVESYSATPPIDASTARPDPDAVIPAAPI